MTRHHTITIIVLIGLTASFTVTAQNIDQSRGNLTTSYGRDAYDATLRALQNGTPISDIQNGAATPDAGAKQQVKDLIDSCVSDCMNSTQNTGQQSSDGGYSDNPDCFTDSYYSKVYPTCKRSCTISGQTISCPGILRGCPDVINHCLLYTPPSNTQPIPADEQQFACFLDCQPKYHPNYIDIAHGKSYAIADWQAAEKQRQTAQEAQPTEVQPSDTRKVRPQLEEAKNRIGNALKEAQPQDVPAPIGEDSLAKQFDTKETAAIGPSELSYFDQNGKPVNASEAGQSGLTGFPVYTRAVITSPGLKTGDTFKVPSHDENLDGIVITAQQDIPKGAQITVSDYVTTPKLLRDVSIPDTYTPIAVHEITSNTGGEALIKWHADQGQVNTQPTMIHSEDGTTWNELKTQCEIIPGVNRYQCVSDPSLGGWYAIVETNNSVPADTLYGVLNILSGLGALIAGWLFARRRYKKKTSVTKTTHARTQTEHIGGFLKVAFVIDVLYALSLMSTGALAPTPFQRIVSFAFMALIIWSAVLLWKRKRAARTLHITLTAIGSLALFSGNEYMIVGLMSIALLAYWVWSERVVDTLTETGLR